MKKVFIIFLITDKDVHIPSTDYYKRADDSQTENISVMREIKVCDTEADADKYLIDKNEEKSWLEGGEGGLDKGTYVILPGYVKK